MLNEEFIGTKSSILTFIDNFIGLIFGWLLHMFLARSLGVNGYGQLSLIIIIFSIFSSWLSPGIAFSMTRYASIMPKPKEALNSGIITELVFDMFTYSIYFLIILTSLFNFLRINELRYFLLLLGIMLMPHGMASVILGYLKGHLEFRKILVINFLYNIGKLLFCSLLIIIGYHLWGAVLGIFFAELVLFISSVIIVKNLRLEKPVLFKAIISISIPFSLLNISGIILQRIDIICINLFSLDFTKIGYYAAASRINEILMIFLSSIYIYLFPVLSLAFYRKNFIIAQQAVMRSLRYCFLLGVPLSLYLGAHSKIILSIIFSAIFDRGAIVLTILSIGSLFFSLAYIFSLVIIANGKVLLLFLINLIFILLSIILNKFLIPFFGINGPAITNLIMMLFIGISMVIYIIKFDLLKLNRDFRLSYKTVVNVLVASFLMVFVSVLLTTKTWYMFAIKTFFSFVIYGVILFLSKEISNDDVRIISFLMRRLMLTNFFKV